MHHSVNSLSFGFKIVLVFLSLILIHLECENYRCTDLVKLWPVMAMWIGSFWTWLTLACKSGIRLSKLSSNSSQGDINKGGGTLNPQLKILKHLERTYLHRRKRYLK